MSHGSNGGGQGLSRKETRIVFTLWVVSLVVVVALALVGSHEFLKDREEELAKRDSSHCVDSTKKNETEQARSASKASDSRSHSEVISGWDEAYGMLLLLHAHPLEAFEEGRKIPFLSRIRVILPFAWELVFAGFLAGLVIFRRRIWDFIRFTIQRPRVVVFGSGPAARSFAQAAAKRKEHVALVLEHPDDSALAFADLHGFPIVRDSFERRSGSGHNFRLSASLRLAWAHEIVFADIDDGRNIDNAIVIAELASRKDGNWFVTLLVKAWHGTARRVLRRPQAWSGLRHAHIADPVLLRGIETSGLMERHGAIPFNWDELRARHAVEVIDPLRDRLSQAPHLADPERDKDLPRFKPVHLFVLGEGSLAAALTLEFVEAGQWSADEPPHVTLVSRNAEASCRALHGQRPQLGKCSKIDFLNIEIPSPELHERFAANDAIDDYRIVFVIAESDPRKAISTALWLSQQRHATKAPILLPSGIEDGSFRILASMQDELSLARDESERLEHALPTIEEGSVAHAKAKSRKGEVDKLRDVFHYTERISVFGDPESARRLLFGEGFFDRERGCFREGAEIFHETYSAITKTDANWSTLHPAFRISNRSAFRHVRHKLSSLGRYDARSLHALLETNMESLARLEHLRWNAERWLAGWRQDPVKSEKDRTSPCLVSWGQLDDKTREYDRISIRTIEKVVSTLDRGGKGDTK